MRPAKIRMSGHHRRVTWDVRWRPLPHARVGGHAEPCSHSIFHARRWKTGEGSLRMERQYRKSDQRHPRKTRSLMAERLFRQNDKRLGSPIPRDEIYPQKPNESPPPRGRLQTLRSRLGQKDVGVTTTKEGLLTAAQQPKEKGQSPLCPSTQSHHKPRLIKLHHWRITRKNRRSQTQGFLTQIANNPGSLHRPS